MQIKQMCAMLTYNLQEVKSCYMVDIPFQFVQNNPLHAKNLSYRASTFAPSDQILSGRNILEEDLIQYD